MYHPISRRRFISQSGKLALGAGLTGSLLAACGGQSAANGDVAGEVLIWIPVDSAVQRKYIQKSEGNDFNDSHKGVTATIEFKPNSSGDRLIQTAVSAGRGPDLVFTSGVATAMQYVKSDLFADLTPYAEKYKWQDKLLGWAYESGKVNGKLYSIPNSYETMIIHYNKTLFESKGYKVPTNRSELEALCTEMQGQGIIPFTAGNADWRPSTEWFVTVFLNHYAGPDAVYQALSGKIHWTDPIFVEAIDLMNQYFQKGWFGGGVQKYFTNGSTAIASTIATGKAGMDMEGSWAFANWKENFGPANGNNNDWDWFPVPPLHDNVPKELYTLATGGTYSINAHSKSKDAAALYLDWLLSTPERVGKEVTEADLQALPVKLEDKDFPAKVDPRIKRLYLQLGAATDQGNFGYTTWTFWPPKSDEYTYTGMDKVLTKSITPAQYCAELDKIFQGELSAGTVPPIIARSK